MSVRKVVLAVLAGLSVAAGASSAQATVFVCTTPNCAPTDTNVLVTAATNVPVVFGTAGSANIEFSSATDPLLIGGANGQAKVESADGLLNSLTFALTGGSTFLSATWNLEPLSGNELNEAITVIISYYAPGLGMQSVSVNTNGQNFMGIYGDAGEMFTSVGFAADPITTGISDLRQLRLGGIDAPPVPEPATWLMMLLGFGAAGIALRRRKRPVMNSLQIA